MTTDHHPRDESRSLLLEAAANTFRPYAGWAFYGFGVLLVLLGWLGISGEAVVAKQLPYLISGGIGGLLLAVLGAYLLGIEALRRDSGRLERLEQQVDELHRALLQRPDAPGPELPAPVGANGHHPGADLRAGPATDVVVVEAGSSFHRPSCALVAGKRATHLDVATATERGLAPCRVCEPVVAVP